MKRNSSTIGRTPWLSRRQMLRRAGAGMGAIGLANVAADAGLLPAAADTLMARQPHFAPRAKRLIYLYMNGGPSQVDTFDYKPTLEKYDGQRPAEVDLKTLRKTTVIMKSPWKFQQYGQSGLWVSDLFPHVARCIDDICVIRSMKTDIPEHAAAMTMMKMVTTPMMMTTSMSMMMMMKTTMQCSFKAHKRWCSLIWT